MEGSVPIGSGDIDQWSYKLLIEFIKANRDDIQNIQHVEEMIPALLRKFDPESLEPQPRPNTSF